MQMLVASVTETSSLSLSQCRNWFLRSSGLYPKITIFTFLSVAKPFQDLPHQAFHIGPIHVIECSAEKGRIFISRYLTYRHGRVIFFESEDIHTMPFFIILKWMKTFKHSNFRETAFFLFRFNDLEFCWNLRKRALYLCTRSFFLLTFVMVFVWNIDLQDFHASWASISMLAFLVQLVSVCGPGKIRCTIW